MKLNQEIYRLEPTSFNQWDLASAWERRGEILRKAGKPKEALAAYKTSLELSLPSLLDNPNSIRTQLDIAISYCKMGIANAEMNNMDGVIDSYQRALEIRLPILKSDPTDVQTCKLVINSYRAIAAAYEKKKDPRLAIENLQLALKTYDNSNAEQKERLFELAQRIRDELERLVSD